MQPIILALSSFRNSNEAIDLAIRLAEKSSRLIICYIIDVNLDRYMIDTPCHAREETREDFINYFRAENLKNATKIQKLAKENDIKEIEIVTDVGRFSEIVLEAANKANPEYIVTTRSNRLNILRKMFGSPVDVIKEKAKCKVVEV